MRSLPVRDLAVLILVWGATCVAGLGSSRLWDRDEPRNAGCVREMMERGDWIVPTFNAELRTHKPVLQYWAIRPFYAAFGVNEWTARLPSALCGLGTILLTYLIGRRLFDPQTGLLAGVAIATSLMFVVASRAATPDAVLILPFTAALAVFVYAVRWETPHRGGSDDWTPSRGASVLMFLLMGVATLAKGPVGFVLPTAIIGMFLLLRWSPKASHTPSTRLGAFVRSTWLTFRPDHFFKTCWRMRPVTAVACITAVALPWYWAVHVQTDGAWTRGFFLDHNLGRATHGMEGHGGNVFFDLAFYPVALIVGTFPWSVFWLPAFLLIVRVLRSVEVDKPAVQFLSCWVAVLVGAFTLAQTKLPSYISPAHPAFCLLTAWAVRRWVVEPESLPAVWPKLAFGSVILVGGLATVGVPVAAHFLLPGEEWLGLVGVAVLATGAASFVLASRGRFDRAVLVHGVGATAFLAAAMSLAAPRVDSHRGIQPMLSAAEASEGNAVVYACLEPSWVFYAGRPLPEFRHAEAKEAAEAALSGRRVITHRSRLTRIEDAVSTPLRVIHESPAFLEDDPFVVVEVTSVEVARVAAAADGPTQ